MVATSTDPGDELLAAYCESLDLWVFRGPLDDVLERFPHHPSRLSRGQGGGAADRRLPAGDHALIDRVIDHHHAAGADYTSNTLGTRTYPHGLDTEVIRPDALVYAAERASDPYEREHETPYIYRRPELFRLAGVARHESLAMLRWTVDFPQDMAFVREVYAKLYPFDPDFDSDAIAALPVNTSEGPP